MADVKRVHVTNRSGLRVAVDIGRDMNQATFDRMVENGDLTPVKTRKTTKES